MKFPSLHRRMRTPVCGEFRSFVEHFPRAISVLAFMASWRLVISDWGSSLSGTNPALKRTLKPGASPIALPVWQAPPPRLCWDEDTHGRHQARQIAPARATRRKCLRLPKSPSSSRRTTARRRLSAPCGACSHRLSRTSRSWSWMMARRTRPRPTEALRGPENHARTSRKKPGGACRQEHRHCRRARGICGLPGLGRRMVAHPA